MSDKSEYKLKQVQIRLKLEGAAPLYSKQEITSPEQAVKVMADVMKTLPKEYVCVVNLDGKNSPINFNVVSIGSIKEAPLTISELYKSSILSNSAAVMVLHNHPSGGIEPSEADWKVTDRLIEAGKLLGIPVVDHVIIGGINGEAYSLREEKPYLFSVSENTPAYNIGKGQQSLKDRVKELTDKLEQGILDLQSSNAYRAYLTSMSHFHSYSLNNSLLISLARPDATRVASYRTWEKQGRHVKKGEKGIPILVPTPYKRKVEQQKTDVLGRGLLDNNGNPIMETVDKLVQHYKIGYVFDVAQTYGEPLPEIAHKLTGKVEDYDRLFEALKDVSPVPISFDKINGNANGYFHNADKRIVIKEGMSQEQTVKTAIHEISHALLHDKDHGTDRNADRNLREQTAESVAYCVCSQCGIDTSDYSFGYILGWAKEKDPKDFKSRLQVIRDTSHDLISKIDERLQELHQEKERDQYLTYYVAECSEYHSLGQVVENLSLEEACDKFTQFTKEKNWMIPSIGVQYHDKTDPTYDGAAVDLLVGKIIDVETVSQIPCFKNSDEITIAVEGVKHAFPDAIVRDGSGVLDRAGSPEKAFHKHR